MVVFYMFASICSMNTNVSIVELPVKLSRAQHNAHSFDSAARSLYAAGKRYLSHLFASLRS